MKIAPLFQNIGRTKGEIVGSHLAEYIEEVIESIQELGHYSPEEAAAMARERRSDIEYGCTYRIRAPLVAGTILGINHCCLGNGAQKPPA